MKKCLHSITERTPERRLTTLFLSTRCCSGTLSVRGVNAVSSAEKCVAPALFFFYKILSTLSAIYNKKWLSSSLKCVVSLSGGISSSEVIRRRHLGLECDSPINFNTAVNAVWSQSEIQWHYDPPFIFKFLSLIQEHCAWPAKVFLCYQDNNIGSDPNWLTDESESATAALYSNHC